MGDVVLRASDEDRERTVSLLREAATRGYLNLEEFEERMGRALGTRFLTELDPLLADIPGMPRPSSGWVAAAARRLPHRRWGAGLAGLGPLTRIALVLLLGACVISAVVQLLAFPALPLIVFGIYYWRRSCRRGGWRHGGRHPHTI
jgi:hypothetical protein